MNTFFQISSAGLAIVATIIWLKEGLKLSRPKILQISRERSSLDDRKKIANELIILKYTGRIVVGIMLLSFVTQMINLSLPKTFDSTAFNITWGIVAIIFCILVQIATWNLVGFLTKKEERQVSKAIDNE